MKRLGMTGADVAVIAGIILLAIGAALISFPLGPIVLGGLLLVVGGLGAERLRRG